MQSRTRNSRHNADKRVIARSIKRDVGACLAMAALLLFGCGGDQARFSGTLTLQAGGGPSGRVSADVRLNEPGVGPQETCGAPLNAGACRLTACQLGGIGSPAMGYGDFGPISASVGATTVPLTYDKFGYGTVYFPEPITLGTGGVMRFQGGDGSTVPKFKVAATIPAPAVITYPVAASDGSAATIDTSHDLPITWLPLPAGTIEVSFNNEPAFSVGVVAVKLVCNFMGSSGAGAVPQTLLVSLKQMSQAPQTFLGLHSSLETKTVVDGLTIVTQALPAAQSVTPSQLVELQ